jgi:hypothetical protein
LTNLSSFDDDNSLTETEKYLGKIFDEMLTSAEVNITNRPFIQSSDSHGTKISLLVIPTLEDLMSVLFVAGNLVEDYGYPSKVTTVEDIVTAAFLAGEYVLASHDRVSGLARHVSRMLSYRLDLFKSECNHSAGTTKILDADGHTKLSLEGLFKKYFPGCRYPN